jgi:hypothetical protein
MPAGWGKHPRLDLCEGFQKAVKYGTDFAARLQHTIHGVIARFVAEFARRHDDRETFHKPYAHEQ